MDDRGDDPPCNAVVELLTAYLEGVLRARDRQLIEHHLGECPYCADYLDQMRFTIRAASRLRRDDVPPELLAALVGAFRAEGRAW